RRRSTGVGRAEASACSWWWPYDRELIASLRVFVSKERSDGVKEAFDCDEFLRSRSSPCMPGPSAFDRWHGTEAPVENDKRHQEVSVDRRHVAVSYTFTQNCG